MYDATISQPDNYAAIVPLDYGPDREELSLIFASYDWSQLAELLKNPAAFFAAQSKNWEQAPERGTVHDWNLMTPSTVILQWVGKTPDALNRTAHVMAHTVPSQASTRKQAVSNLLDHFEDKDALKTELRKCFPKGMFLAEFAFKTRTLFIRYHPAEVRKNAKKGAQRHFTGTFTNATANKLMPLQDGRIAASVHIDIGRTDEDRSHFIMDFLEDCSEFFSEALGKAPEFFVGDVPLVEKNGTIKIQSIADGARPKVKMRPENPFPTVYMETPPPAPVQALKDGSLPINCLVCVMSNGEWHSPTLGEAGQGAVYYVGNTIVKCYSDPPPIQGS